MFIYVYIDEITTTTTTDAINPPINHSIASHLFHFYIFYFSFCFFIRIGVINVVPKVKPVINSSTALAVAAVKNPIIIQITLFHLFTLELLALYSKLKHMCIYLLIASMP